MKLRTRNINSKKSHSILELRPRVYQIICEEQYHLTSSFMRLQEFYESPLKGIRGQYFTHEKFMDAYTSSKPFHQFTYFEDWSGFNVPGNVVQRFYALFGRNLWEKEKKLFKLLSEKVPSWKKHKDFYLIGTLNNDHTAIRHEMAHAYWYLSSVYRRRMRTVMSRYLSSRARKKFESMLLGYGYMSGVVDDEIQAIMSAENIAQSGYHLDFKYDARLPVACADIFEQFDSQWQTEKINVFI